MRFKISTIQPNPFRHMDRYPIRRDKVAALRESLRTTGFWDNVVARLVDGKPQIAYGHHRLVALREEYKPGHVVDLIIRELSDEDMLKIMARENMEEWGTSAAVEHETVRAVIEAYSAGRVTLRQLDGKTARREVRFAPSFRMNAVDVHPSHPYTATSVAEFLGWLEPTGRPQHKVVDALAALEFIELGVLAEEDFTGLGTDQARAVVSQTRRAHKEREARAQAARKDAERAERDAKAARDEAERKQAEKRKADAEKREQKEAERARKQASTVGRHVAEGLKSGHGTKQAADLAAEKRGRREGPPQDINRAVKRLATTLHKIFGDRDDRAKKLDEVVAFREHISEDVLLDLDEVLADLVNRIEEYRRRLGATAQESSRVVDINQRKAVNR